jgi:4-hydroxy-3-polyprenylbenzoate decarboxylase
VIIIKIIVGITGASGSIYGVRLLEELLSSKIEVHLIITKTGEKVLKYETSYDVLNLVKHLKSFGDTLIVHDVDDLFASVASGSFKADAMVIIPCSMSTLAEMSSGITKNLLTRASDVCLKERRKLIIVPRETPLNNIHLKNMLMLSEAGAIILPAAPGFYHKPSSIDDMVNFIIGKVFDMLNIDNKLFTKWGDIKYE